MELFAASIFALIVGPLCIGLLRRRPGAVAVLDGFVLTTLVGVVGLHLLPEALSHAGLPAAVAAVLGLFLPTWVERRLPELRWSPLVVVAMAGLAVHALVDGVALGGAEGGHHHEHAHGHMLAVAVLLHRLPLGLTIWWTVRPRTSFWGAAAVLGIVIASTAVGFFSAGAVFDVVPERGLAVFQALVAGSLLHVVTAHGPMEGIARGRGSRGLTALGAVVGIAAIGSMLRAHPAEQRLSFELDAQQAFVALALESAPALLLAFLLAGVVSALIGARSLRWLSRGKPSVQAAKGVAFGLPLPICSCGVLPMYRSLYDHGVPAAAAMAFLVATPEIGLDAILLSVPLLGWDLAAARVVCAALVALVVGAVVGGRLRREVAPRSMAPVPEVPLRERLAAGVRFGLVELVDHVGPWILAGLAIAALLEPTLETTWLGEIPGWLLVPVMAVAGMPLYVCASGATPLVAVLMHKGLSAGAAIAFLLTGPATNITTFGVLSRLHGRRGAVWFAVVVGGLAIGLGYLVDALGVGTAMIPLHEVAHDEPAPWRVACLLVLAGMFAASLWRQGPRGMLGQVLAPHDHHHHHDHGEDQGACCDHDHDHHHGHDHHHHGHDHRPQDLAEAE